MRKNRSFYLKSKVLLGFGFILIAIAGATIVAYNSYKQLSYAVRTISGTDTKLQQIDSIMFMVDKSENSLQEYTITKSAKKLQEYDNQLTDIRHRVQQLTGMSAFDEIELDSILDLINVKLISMDAFMKIKDRRDVFKFYDRAIEQLEKEQPSQEKIPKNQVTIQKDTIDSLVQSQPQETTQVAEVTPNKTVDEEAEKKWLRRFVGRVFGGKKEETDSIPQLATVPDTLSDTLVAEVDTTILSNFNVDSVRQMLNELKSEQAATEKYLDRQELQYLANNAEVMNQINDFISEVKQARQQNYQEQSQEAREILATSLSRLGFILLIALGSTFIFIYLIFSDIAKSDFLKSQLETAKARAEQLARVKENFLANMSHEIRTPLTAILGFTGQLKNTKLQGAQQEYLSAVDSSSSHLLTLVNDILDFSKIEAGQLKFEHQPFDMKALVKQVYYDMQFQAEKKDLQIHWEIKGEEHRYLKGDAFRLKQVLYNLISNAIKFTEEGGVIVRCKLKPLPGGRVKAQLEIVDTGIGIPVENQKNVFEAFVQSDISDTRKYGGTGLGLSISKKIVESQGGEMALESEVGEGSTFYLALPYDLSSQEELARSVLEATPLKESVFPESKMLIIDDDPLNTKLLSLIVEKWGIITYSAHSGHEGLEILGQVAVDLVLTDLQMPGMHGEEVVAQIRASDKAPLPVIAFTARVTENKHYFKEKGFTDVLHKPFQEREVYQLIEKYLASKAISLSVGQQENRGEENIIENEESQSFYSLANIIRFIGDDQEAMLGFLDSFMRVMVDSVAEIKKGTSLRDIQLVAYHAHKMFPNVQQLEVNELAGLLKELEQYGQQVKEGVVLKDFPLDETVEKVIHLTDQLLAALNEKKELLKTDVT